jgi:transposase-like protein
MNTVAELDFSDKAFEVRWSRVREDWWGDIKQQTLRGLKRLLETTLEIEVQDVVGAARDQRWVRRRTYRNGYYTRNLLTSVGYLTGLLVPRVRSGRVEFKTLARYGQRSPDVDRAILEMFLSGTSTRRVKEVVEPLLGPQAMSASTVSRLTKVLDPEVKRFHARPLPDTYEYLIFDGVYLRAKSPVRSRKRCVLVAYGLKANGLKELIDFELVAQGESQAAWERFLTMLKHRGLEGRNLKLITVDGNKGLWNALDMIWPGVKRQRCWAHKLRNVVGYLPKRFQEACMNEARDIYAAEDKAQAVRAFRNWARVWRKICPRAVACLEQDFEDMLAFFDCPKAYWVRLRTTNMIERVFREVRRRTRPMSCFQNAASMDRIIFAIFFRLNSIWRRKPLLLRLTQKS